MKDIRSVLSPRELVNSGVTHEPQASGLRRNSPLARWKSDRMSFTSVVLYFSNEPTVSNIIFKHKLPFQRQNSVQSGIPDRCGSNRQRRALIQRVHAPHLCCDKGGVCYRPITIQHSLSPTPVGDSAQSFTVQIAAWVGEFTISLVLIRSSCQLAMELEPRSKSQKSSLSSPSDGVICHV